MLVLKWQVAPQILKFSTAKLWQSSGKDGSLALGISSLPCTWIYCSYVWCGDAVAPPSRQLLHTANSYAQEIAIVIELTRWFEEVDEEAGAAKWQEIFDSIRQ